MAEEEDIISTLPDAILCHILSFLKTKQSIVTSILSKRWNPLWRSVPALYFDFDEEDEDRDSGSDFNDFVSSVLLSRDSALPIKSFHLQVPNGSLFGRPIGIESFPKWVNFVVQRRLEYLNLHLAWWANLPINVLTCKTLVVLKLYCFNVDLGPSVLLPSLKTLHLEGAWFRKLKDFMLFLAGCPILEDLFTSYLRFDYMESLTCNEWKSFYLSNLARADIECSSANFPLKAVHNVPSLRFEISQVAYYLDKNDLIPDFHIPTFHNLTHLELICYDYSNEFLLDVLNHCPKLQRLDLNGMVYGEKDDKTNWEFPNVVPQCLSLYLRTCNLLRFRGLHGELMLAKYILKNAEVLQTMKVWNRGRSEVKKILSSFPRASSNCELAVNHVPFPCK